MYNTQQDTHNRNLYTFLTLTLDGSVLSPVPLSDIPLGKVTTVFYK
jgi:hypothetical protein